ncbi:MAG: ABC transporter permease [Dehalococcoidales bacterium]|nr:ABC transporter permease [Dehalococcoidales bacterium]
MTAFIIRRLLQSIVVLIIVTVLVFVAMRLLPGDPLLLFIQQGQASEMQEEQLEKLRHEYGLDQPMAVQYFTWIGNMFRGDLGKSIFYDENVTNLIADRLPVSLYMGMIAFVLSGIIGILAGIISAIKRNTWIDNVVTVLANIGITIPVFWLGIILIYFISLKFHLLPTAGYTSPFDDFWLSTKQLIMPVICLSLFPLAAMARQTRSSMLEIIRQDFIRTAKAKGLREMIIVFRHEVKNAIIPVITLLGMQISLVVGGMVLIEAVFNIPGMGRLLVSAVYSQDYAVVQACVLVTAVAVVLSNLAVDISYGWFDPRIRLGRS